MDVLIGAYGLEVVKETVEETGAALFVLPGDDRPDPDLISHSTVSSGDVHQLWRYFIEAGVENFVNALQFVADICLGTSYNPDPPNLRSSRRTLSLVICQKKNPKDK